MSPAAQHRVIRSGGGGGVFVLRMRTLWGVLLIFMNFFFFFLTQTHRSRRTDCHQLPWSSSWLPCTPAPPRGSAPGRIHNFTDVPDPCFNRPRAEQPGRRSLREKKTKRRKLEEISHPWVFSHHCHHCHHGRHHTLFFMHLSHKQS